MNKYRNKKVIVDGEEFDSKKEGNRYKELRLLDRVGEISTVELDQDLYNKINLRKTVKLTER